MTTTELLAEPAPVARSLEAALARPGVGMIGHWMVQELLRRSHLYDDLLNALASPNPLTRAAAARICAAARMTDSIVWLADLVRDKNSAVRDAAVRALAGMGGRRAVDVLMEATDVIPTYRLAIALSRAASDIDIEALLRQPETEAAAVAIVLACGLRCDVLRIPPLVGIAHDRRWPRQVRKAACKALAMIGDRSASDALSRLEAGEPDASVKKAAEQAHKRLVKRAVAK